MKVNPLRYVVLAALFICGLAFQATVSLNELKTIWSQAQHFETSLLANWALLLNLHVLTPFACLLLGFYVASVRIWDLKAWLLLAVLVTFSVESDCSNVRDEVMAWQTPLKHLALVYRSVVINAWPLCMLLFAIYFPERAPFDQRRPALKWVALLPAIAISLGAVVVRVARNEGAPNGAVQAIDAVVEIPRLVAVYGLLALFLVLLWMKMKSARDFDERRRLRVLFSGLAVSFIPAIFVEGVLRRIFRLSSIPWWVAVPAYSALALFPLTIAYVTVVQRALDVRVILRQGLQYGLARRGLLLVQIVVSLIVVLLVALLSGRMTFLERVGITAAGIALIFLVTLAARRLAGWVDRRFFREAYNAEQILARLSDSVGSLVELQPLLRTVATRIAEALHISEIAVFLCEQNSYRLAFAWGILNRRKRPSRTNLRRLVNCSEQNKLCLSTSKIRVPGWPEQAGTW